MKDVHAVYHGGRTPHQRALIDLHSIDKGRVLAKLIDQMPPWNEWNWFSLKSFKQMSGLPFEENCGAVADSN